MMINKEEAKIEAWLAIAELVGINYFRSYFEGSCQAYPPDEYDGTDYEYFLGFESNKESGKWTVFARVSVNREIKEVIFLDYKTPDGHRIEKPIKPTSFA